MVGPNSTVAFQVITFHNSNNEQENFSAKKLCPKLCPRLPTWSFR